MHKDSSFNIRNTPNDKNVIDVAYDSDTYHSY